MLPDGSYDVLVVDASTLDGEAGFRLDLTIVAGEHKGEVVTVNATGLVGEEFELLAMPGTLEVRNGAPVVALDR